MNKKDKIFLIACLVGMVFSLGVVITADIELKRLDKEEEKNEH